MRMGPYHHARVLGARNILSAHGAQVLVAQVCSRDHYAWDTPSTVSEEGYRTLFPGRDYRQLRSRLLMDRVTDWLEDERVDVVVTNGWAVPEARAALVWAGRSKGRRAVVMSETKADELPRVFWKEWVKRRILSPASAGLVGGELQAQYLASLGVPRERIFLGYNAVDNAYFRDGSLVARQHPGPLGGVPYFFACARFMARKNLDGLLRAYAVYRSAAGSAAWSLVLSGSGEEETALRSLCAALKLDGHVHWPGFLQYPELPKWYGHASAFIHPAKAEPWGLVVNEAAACGLPLLVAAPVGSRYELVQDGVSGLVFDPFSDRAIADVLIRVSSVSVAERHAMGAAAQRRVEDYGPKRFGEGLLAAVRAAVAAPR
jgi:glycosyltransferase involved in cell wall biosynthesis